MSPFHRIPRHARRGSSLRAGFLAVAATVTGVIALGAGLAFGYWVSTDSSNPAAASATSLSTPSVSAVEASATAVKISWTSAGQPVGTNYIVVRNPGANQVAVCTVPASTSNCTDSGLSPATAYSYAVTADLDAWQSTAGTASFTTMGVNIATPAGGSTFGGNWGGSISGTSSPASGTTIATVKVSIQQGNGSCWTGTGNTWTAVCPTYVATGGTVGAWNLTLPAGDLNSVNTYHIAAQATDPLGTAATATSSFTYNTMGPSPTPPGASATTHSTDSNGVYWVNAETVNLSDTVTDTGAGTVSSVAYYYCSTSSCNGSNGTLIGSGSGAGWSYPWPASNLPGSDGTYYIVAVATDSLSNTGTSSATEIGVDRTPPTVSAPSVNGAS
jgi:hypothetical protein